MSNYISILYSGFKRQQELSQRHQRTMFTLYTRNSESLRQNLSYDDSAFKNSEPVMSEWRNYYRQRFNLISDVIDTMPKTATSRALITCLLTYEDFSANLTGLLLPEAQKAYDWNKAANKVIFPFNK